MKTLEQRLLAQYKTAELLADSSTTHEAVPKILQIITVGLKWSLGVYWVLPQGKEQLELLTSWVCPGVEIQDFLLESQGLKFNLDEGLPGRAWGSKSPLWIAGLNNDSNFPRKAAAAKAGFQTGLCFPLLFRGKIFGVMEFFSRELHQPDNQILELLAAIGNQIGQFIERIKSEEALRNSESRKTTILNAALDCIITMDESGNITEFNPAAEKTFGYSREYVLGKPLADLIIPPAYRESHKKGLARYLETKQSAIIGKRIELKAIKSDGTEFPAELTIIDLHVAPSTLFTGFIRDISLQKEAEYTKTLFFGGAGNEFKTPLHLILGPAADALLDTEQSLQPRQLERMVLIQRNARRLLKLSNALLDFSKLEAGHLQCSCEALDLAKLTQDIADLYRGPIEKGGLIFVHEISPLDELSYVDSSMWEKVVFNLLSNAFKYTLSGNITISLKKEGDYAVLSVMDTGIGIPEKEIPRAFERFHRIQHAGGRSEEGMGIGLALSSALIKLHSGSVEVKSKEGEGSTFTVKLPLGKAHLSEKQIKTPKQSSRLLKVDLLGITFVEEALSWLSQNIPNKPLSPLPVALDFSPRDSSLPKPDILFAEENADMRRYVQDILSPFYNVHIVLDGEMALQTAVAQKFDLILIDIILPKINGLQLIQNIKINSKTKNIPIILLSTNNDAEDCIEGLELGADDHLSKPFSARELLARIKTHLELGRSREELYKSIQERTLELQQEIVKHSQTEAALVKSEKSYRVLANISPVGIFHADKAGEILYINKRALEIMGINNSQEGPLSFVAGLAPADKERVLAAWNKSAQNHASFKAEYRYVYENGEEVWVISEAVPEKDDISGKLSGYIGTITDITELKALEQARLEAIQVAEEQQRRRAEEAEAYRKRQEEFIDTMCHELRNPLNGIYGSVTLLQSNADMLESFINSKAAQSLETSLKRQILEHLNYEKETIDTIDKCARHQKVITDDILNLSKLEAGKVELISEIFDPKKVIEDVCTMLETDINKKNIQLSLQFPHRNLSVKGDPNRVAQILLNLATNAIKFTPVNGEIQISVSQLSSTLTVKTLQFCVKDSGIGLTGEEKAKLFNRFAQANRNTYQEYGGSGLGLAICKNLVELMGGKIKVESEKTKGSQFIFTIQCKPVIKEQEKKKTPEDSPKTQPSAKINPQILIVEDNLINQKILSTLLKNAGFRHYVASNGKEGVEMFESIPIDIILMDIEMPFLNGLEATRVIRSLESTKELPSPPVVIIGLSGNAREEHVKAALNAGMNDYLVKPYEKDKLLEKINHFMANRAPLGSLIHATSFPGIVSASPLLFTFNQTAINPALVTAKNPFPPENCTNLNPQNYVPSLSAAGNVIISAHRNNCGLYALAYAAKMAVNEQGTTTLTPEIKTYLNSISAFSLQQADQDTNIIGLRLREQLSEALLKNGSYKSNRLESFIQIAIIYIERNESQEIPTDMEAFFKTITNQEFLRHLNDKFYALDIDFQKMKSAFTESRTKLNNYTITLYEVEAFARQIESIYAGWKNATIINKSIVDAIITNLFKAFNQDEQAHTIRAIKLIKLYRVALQKINVTEVKEENRALLSSEIEQYIFKLTQNAIFNSHEKNVIKEQLCLFALLNATNLDVNGDLLPFQKETVAESLIWKTMIELFIRNKVSNNWDTLYRSYCDFIKEQGVFLSIDELAILAQTWNVSLAIAHPDGKISEHGNKDLTTLNLCNLSETHWEVPPIHSRTKRALKL